jgi:hypothetical protein
LFNVIPIKIPMAFITEIETLTLNSFGTAKKPLIAKVIPSKKSNVAGIKIPDSKLQIHSSKNSMRVVQKRM